MKSSEKERSLEKHEHSVVSLEDLLALEWLELQLKRELIHTVN